MNLTYSLIYTPSLENTKYLDFICFDNKIHFRFKDFNKEQRIIGFEKKLTYLMCYLFNFEFVDNINLSTNENLKKFYKMDDVIEIYEIIRETLLNPKFKGFKAYINYKRFNKTAYFGELDKDCFPLLKDEGVYKKGSLKTFLNLLNIDLKNYLFNDAYSILIHKNKNEVINEKFINKQNKKESNKTLEYEQLW